MLLALIALAALAGAPPPRPTAEDHLATAEHFARKGWLEDAWQEVQAGLALPEGAESFGLHRLAMELAWERLDPLGSAAAARRAAGLCAEEELAASLRERADALERGFGTLRVDAAQPGLRSRLQLEARGPLLDPEHRRYVQRLATRLREPQDLPRVVALPVGTYLLNGEEAAVRADEPAALVLPLRALGLRGMAALQVVRLEVGAVLGQAHGGPLAPRPPRPELALGISLPAGPLFLGGELLLSLDPAQAPMDGLGPGVGAHLGREWALWGPLSLRPALRYRGWRESRLRLSCVDESTTTWSCGLPRDDAPAGIDLPLDLHALGAELGVEWRTSGRTTATGLAILVGEELGLRRLPAAGRATLEGSDQAVEWSTDRPWLTVPSLRLGARLSLVL